VTIKAQLEIERDDEPELPLGHQDSVGDPVPLEGLGDPPSNPDIEETLSRTGRKIQNAAKKKGKK
jgi:hypothetical protein